MSRHTLSTSAIVSFIAAEPIDKLLRLFVPDAADRKYLLRCLLEQGPAHHRGANFVLLSLLSQVIDRLPTATKQSDSHSESVNAIPIPMRLPPHLSESSPDRFFPLQLHPLPVHQMPGATEQHVAAMVDCLIDGPPQHALANVLMVNLIARILDALPEAQ
jgi:hypothetical protein